MNKRRLNYTLPLVVVLSFLLVLGLSGCTTLTSGEKDFSGPTRGSVGKPETFPLYAGQTMPVGEVQVWNNGENVCVKYQLSDEAIAEGWLIYETHLAVGTTLGDIPQTKKGNPIPGQFPYGNDNLGGVESYQKCVPLPAGVDCNNDIIIAAHAVVGHITEGCVDLYSDTSTTFENMKSGNSGNAGFAWQPYDYDSPYLSSGSTPNSTWDNGVNHSFSDNAHWIWEAYRVADPLNGDIVYFTKTFDIPGIELLEITTFEMHVTCDNGYEFYVNGVLQGSAQLFGEWENSKLTQSYVNSDGWQSVEHYTGFGDDLHPGTNTLLFKAANEYMGPLDGQSDGTIETNPAGLIYEGRVCYTVVDQEETAWGAGTGFSGANWATYFTYKIQ